MFIVHVGMLYIHIHIFRYFLFLTPTLLLEPPSSATSGEDERRRKRRRRNRNRFGKPSESALWRRYRWRGRARGASVTGEIFRQEDEDEGFDEGERIGEQCGGGHGAVPTLHDKVRAEIYRCKCWCFIDEVDEICKLRG